MHIIPCQADLMSFLKRFFPTDAISLEKSWMKRLHKKAQVNLKTKIEKKESPCKGWKPCPSERKLGNVTTGLQGDSLNGLESLTVHICTKNVDLIKNLILL